MKKSFVLVAIATFVCSCCSVKESNTINWEEACEISWAEFLRVNNCPDIPWEEQPDSIQNEYLDCWAGSAQEDSLLMNYTIEY